MPMAKASSCAPRDIDQFYSMLNEIAAEGLVKIDAVAPADDDANAIYQYLIGTDGSAS